MNKLLLSLTLFATLIFSSTSFAADKSIAMYSGHSTGGLSTAFQTVVAEELGKRGWDVDFKIIGNCGKVVNLLETSDKPILAGWGADWNIDTNICNRPPKASNFIETTVISARLVCGPVGDTTFDLVTGKKYVIGVNQGQNHQVILAALGKKLDVEFKVVEYKNSGAIAKAMQAKEINAWYTTKGLVDHNAGKQRCVLGTLEKPAFGIVPLNTLLDTDNVYSSFVGYLTTNDKFSPELRAALQKDVSEIVQSKEYREKLAAKGSFVTDGDAAAQMSFINATSRAFIK
jgi:hypothetical protein